MPMMTELGWLKFMIEFLLYCLGYLKPQVSVSFGSNRILFLLTTVVLEFCSEHKISAISNSLGLLSVFFHDQIFIGYVLNYTALSPTCLQRLAKVKQLSCSSYRNKVMKSFCCPNED